MTLRDMEIYVKVAREGNMNSVARELFISASSVSQRIKAVEAELGLRLFDRVDRRLYLTEEGRNVLSYMEEILTSRQRLSRYAEGAAKGPVRLRAGATITVGTCILGGLAEKLTAEGIEAVCVIENTRILEHMLLKGDLDIALVEGEIQDGHLCVTPALKDELVAVCGPGHPWWGRDKVNIRECAGQPLILREEGSGTRAQLLDELSALGLEPEIRWSSASTEAIKNAVAAGLGVSVISGLLIRSEAAEGRLWGIKIEGADLTRTFDIVYHKGRTVSGPMERFIDLCRKMG